MLVFQFVLHLGVATGSTGIILEQTGKNLGYRDKDVRGFCPESHCCVEGGPEKLDSLINMRTVCKELNRAGVDVRYSRDAGRYRGHLCCIQRHWRKCKNRACVCVCVLLLRYLCDFAYYCSLYHGERKAALVHLPTSGYLASVDRLVPLLRTLLRTLLAQLENLRQHVRE